MDEAPEKMTRKFISRSTGLFILFACGILSCKEEKKKSVLPQVAEAIVKFEDAKKFHADWNPENTLVSHLTGEPENLHPTNGSSGPRSEIITYLHDYLIKVDPETQELIPSMVESLPVEGQDGLTYEYTLKKNYHWDDGQPLSVADIIFTAKANKCFLTKNPAVKAYWKNLSEIIPDPGNPAKFILKMKEINIQNVAFLTSFPVLQEKIYDPNKLLQAYSLAQLDNSSAHPENDSILIRWAEFFNDDAFGRVADKMSGAGAYRLLNWEPGQFISLIKKSNPNSATVAYPEKIIFKLNKDENSTQLEFKSQLMDVSTNLSTSAYFALSSSPPFNENYNHALTISYNYTYLAFNTRPEATGRNPVFSDLITRKALAMLTPVDLIIKMIYKEYRDRCKRMVGPVSPLKKEFNSNLKPIPFDVETGNKLLAEAGWIDNDGDGILEKTIDHKIIPFQVELMYLTTATDWKDMAGLIAEQYEKAGIKVVLQAADVKLFIEKARGHNFDMMIGSWGATPLPEDYTQLWHTTSWEQNGSNYPGFGNAASDALIDSIRIELDITKRTHMVHRLQEMIVAEQPMVFLYSNLRRNIVHKRFGNVSLYPDRPGILLDRLRLLSTSMGITQKEEVNP